MRKVLCAGKPAEELFEGACTDEVKHMHHYLKLVIYCDIPMSTYNKMEHRRQSKFRSPLCDKKVRETMHKLTKIVEGKIGNAMKKAKIGQLSSDAWTKFSHHYIVSLATFVHKKKVITVMLSLSPLPGRRVVVGHDG